MPKNFNIQVQKNHYYSNYDDQERFISYFYQTSILKNLNPKNILEIGVGNKTVANYLKQAGFIVETVDFDSDLQPDYVADIRNLPFPDNSYEAILACEILEHIPWEDVPSALNELNRISQRYVVLSIPYSSLSFEMILKFPLIKTLFKRKYFDIFFRIPLFFLNYKFNNEHYWEIGRKNYSLSKVRKALSEKLIIIKEIRPELNSYNYFFILEKK